jgi:hypothetical protein
MASFQDFNDKIKVESFAQVGRMLYETVKTFRYKAITELRSFDLAEIEIGKILGVRVCVKLIYGDEKEGRPEQSP